MSLNALYGPGTLAGLAALFELDGIPAPELTQADAPNGNVRARAQWGPAWMKMEFAPTSIRFLAFDAGGLSAIDLYTKLCATEFPAYFEARGVTRLEATPKPGARTFLLSRGQWVAAGPTAIVWPL